MIVEAKKDIKVEMASFLYSYILGLNESLIPINSASADWTLTEELD